MSSNYNKNPQKRWNVREHIDENKLNLQGTAGKLKLIVISYFLQSGLDSNEYHQSQLGPLIGWAKTNLWGTKMTNLTPSPVGSNMTILAYVRNSFSLGRLVKRQFHDCNQPSVCDFLCQNNWNSVYNHIRST